MTHPNLFVPSNFSPCLVAVGFSLAATCFLGTVPARADELSVIKDLQVSGKTQDALAKVNQELTSKPKDAPLRFIKGVLLADSGRAAEAIAVFQRLTEDNPKLPEPYNNLAVLYASTGQFDKAKLALESAIRTNPSYATAHENLGDVYARMAAEAYGKALQLDVSKTQVQPKLAMIRDLVASPALGGAKVAAPVPAAPSTQVVVATIKPMAPALPTPSQANVTKPVSPSLPTTSKPVASASTPVVKPQEQVKPTEPTKQQAIDTKPIEQAVAAWASAWSAKDLTGYMASYTPEFVPVSGGTHKAWEEERKVKILGKSRISVKISALAVSLDANGAVARFRQDYSADALQTSTRKTLHLVKRGNRWLISKEVSG